MPDGLFETKSPSFSPAEASSLAQQHFGIEAQARLLRSERDQNFQLVPDGGPKYVLKIANAAESVDVLRFQNAALDRLKERDPSIPVPRVHHDINGQPIIRVIENEVSYFVRLVSFLEGTPLSEQPRSEALYKDLGRLLGRLDIALTDFSHPGAEHTLFWDIKQCAGLQGVVNYIPDLAARKLASTALRNFEERALPILDRLRWRVIHNDAIPKKLDRRPRSSESIAGIIDFGDMVRTPLIAEIAVAAAHQIFGEPDPLSIIATMTRAYHSIFPLEQIEIEGLHTFIIARLAMRVAISMWRTNSQSGDFGYDMTANGKFCETIETLLAIGATFTADRIKAACTGPRNEEEIT